MSKYRNRNSKSDGIFDVLVEISSMIPWWVSLTIAALLFYFVPYPTATNVEIIEFSNMSQSILGLLFKAFFKFLIPMAFVFGSIMNIFGKVKSSYLFKSISKNGAHQTVQKLNWQDFEFLLSEWFKKEGYSTELTGGGGADGGIDIKLYKNNELYLVQCKHYKAWKVPVTVVRELYGVMTAEKASGGFVVTSGRFTIEAQTFAKGKQIELIDGVKLEEILDSGSLTNQSLETERNKELCPKCGNPLTERKGKYGQFIGCSTYPKCHFTKQIIL